MGTKEGNRYLYLTTPLGEDKLLLSGFTGKEALSELFEFDLELLADNSTTVDFDRLIGQKVSFGVQGADSRLEPRNMHGIVIEFSQCSRDFEFTAFKMKIVPEVWKLTRKFRSRIFQHITIPDLLKQLFAGFDVAFEFQGTYEPREYITQYQESDFAFASRLMEEEGIFYFFRFTRGAHKLVLADSSQSHSDIPDEPKLIFDALAGAGRDEERISDWSKMQVWDSGKYTLWDDNFQTPHKHLEAEKIVKEKVQVGKVSHKLKVAGNEDLEVLEYPGRYALRFDGIDKGGGQHPSDLQKIFQDNKRTTDLRMQLTEAGMLEMRAVSNCRQITAGHKFGMQRHFNGDGQYVITQVTHDAAEGSFRSNEQPGSENHYGNKFSSQPYELPYRPERDTARPTIAGTTNGVVVGPGGEEIFTDQYGRVKVKFMWDPASDSTDTSCWMRVATAWAGQNFGSIFIPRIGDEVLVGFENGDIDHPFVLGSLWNPDRMPPYTLPDHKTVSAIKSRSSQHGTKDNYNELRFEDLKGKEQVFVHAERDKDERVKKESREHVGASRHLVVGGNQLESVGGNKHGSVGEKYYFKTKGDQHLKCESNVYESIKDNREFTLGGNDEQEVKGNIDRKTSGDERESIGGSLSVSVSGSHNQKNGGDYAHQAMDIHLKADAMVVIEAGTGITLKVGGNFITISPAGVAIQGTLVLVNSGGAPLSLPDASPTKAIAPSTPVLNPDAPNTADDGTKFDKM